jgi:hypothetical protein
MDVWLDPIYNQYISENIANRVHELTSIALSKRDRTILYLGGNIDDANKDRGIIFKMQESTSNFNQIWRYALGDNSLNYCIDDIKLYGVDEGIMIAVGFTLPIATTGCNGYLSIA